MLAQTPPPPYYAVIFTSVRTDVETDYADTAAQMMALGSRMPGFLGLESAREDVGITVSYWDSLESIRAWKQQADHLAAQRTGRQRWYAAYQTRICRMERDYSFAADAAPDAPVER